MPQTDAERLIELEADYAAVHAAWLKALKEESTSIDNGPLARSKTRPKSVDLYSQKQAIYTEIQSLERGGTGGPTLQQIVPIDG